MSTTISDDGIAKLIAKMEAERDSQPNCRLGRGARFGIDRALSIVHDWWYASQRDERRQPGAGRRKR